MSRQNSIYLALGIVIGALCILAMGQRSGPPSLRQQTNGYREAPEVIRAQSFEVVDERGLTVARLSREPGAVTQLALYDQRGSMRYTVGVLDERLVREEFPDAPAGPITLMALYDSREKGRLAAMVGEAGAKPYLALNDWRQQPVWRALPGDDRAPQALHRGETPPKKKTTTTRPQY